MTYTYDGAGNTLKTGGMFARTNLPPALASASFTYDSFGRRTGKTINGTITNFVYDGLNPVQEKNGATVTANLLTGLGINDWFVTEKR